jgi:hypothetical protein
LCDPRDSTQSLNRYAFSGQSVTLAVGAMVCGSRAVSICQTRRRNRSRFGEKRVALVYQIVLNIVFVGG